MATHDKFMLGNNWAEQNHGEMARSVKIMLWDKVGFVDHGQWCRDNIPWRTRLQLVTKSLITTLGVCQFTDKRTFYSTETSGRENPTRLLLKTEKVSEIKGIIGMNMGLKSAN